MELAAKVDLSDRGIPQGIFIRDSDVLQIKSFMDGAMVYHGDDRNPKKTPVYQNYNQIQQARNPDAYSVSISSAGSVQGDATVITAYFNIVSSGVTDGGVIIPDENVCRVDNDTLETVKVYPPVGKNFEFMDVNAPFLLLAGESYFFAKD